MVTGVLFEARSSLWTCSSERWLKVDDKVVSVAEYFYTEELVMSLALATPWLLVPLVIYVGSIVLKARDARTELGSGS